MTDTLYDTDRPFGLPVKTRLLPFDPDPYQADAVSGFRYEPVDPRDSKPDHALDTYSRQD